MTAFDNISVAFSGIVTKFKDATSDGKVTLTEAFQLVVQAAQDVVRLTQQLPVTGADKKAAALEALSQFIDQVITPLDLPGVPNFIEPIIDRSLKQLLMLAADAAIEAAVRLFNQIGWPGPKELPEG